MKKIIAVLILIVLLFTTIPLLLFHHNINSIESEISESHKHNFNLYVDSFELILNFLCSNFGFEENASLSIISEDSSIVSLYHNENYFQLSNELKIAFNSIKNAFDYRDFSFIDINKNRISFGGLGNYMFVFSRNGEQPDYFYHPEDTIAYTRYILNDNWYLLVNKAR